MADTGTANVYQKSYLVLFKDIFLSVLQYTQL